MCGPFEMPAGYDAWKTRSPYDDHTFECSRCDDQGCDDCCETEEAHDLEDLEERCGDYLQEEQMSLTQARVVNLSSGGFGIECRDASSIPDWNQRGYPDLAGPFATKRDAQAALDNERKFDDRRLAARHGMF